MVQEASLFTIIVDNIATEQNDIVFLPNQTLKPRPLDALIYKGCHLNEKLCIVNVTYYVLHTTYTMLHSCEREFGQYQHERLNIFGKSHKPVSLDEISRWIKDNLGMADIKMNFY